MTRQRGRLRRGLKGRGMSLEAQTLHPLTLPTTKLSTSPRAVFPLSYLIPVSLSPRLVSTLALGEFILDLLGTITTTLAPL